jgi:chloramphenicol 3-O-phosphotransferase
VLLPSLAALAARDAGREHKGYGTWSVEEVHSGFVTGTPRIGVWLDTTDLTPEETVDEIVARTTLAEPSE